MGIYVLVGAGSRAFEQITTTAVVISVVILGIVFDGWRDINTDEINKISCNSGIHIREIIFVLGVAQVHIKVVAWERLVVGKR